ncbi:hypothetical protein M501DRAFT_869587 [Patellaria atrata CBS 101060]|uniref:Uncharacterized protein n=1 Tax=Patellaria atrata CBS 101060 TaxID=1346257 RepID=A0A9P4VS80_9PEZI|nr:hypothetical protein M501DRAFT_869587 [Patellaria atrata CBS 101060]
MRTPLILVLLSLLSLTFAIPTLSTSNTPLRPRSPSLFTPSNTPIRARTPHSSNIIRTRNLVQNVPLRPRSDSANAPLRPREPQRRPGGFRRPGRRPLGRPGRRPVNFGAIRPNGQLNADFNKGRQ